MVVMKYFLLALSVFGSAGLFLFLRFWIFYFTTLVKNKTLTKEFTYGKVYHWGNCLKLLYKGEEKYAIY